MTGCSGFLLTPQRADSKPASAEQGAAAVGAGGGGNRAQGEGKWDRLSGEYEEKGGPLSLPCHRGQNVTD